MGRAPREENSNLLQYFGPGESYGLRSLGGLFFPLCVCAQLCPTLCDPMDCSPSGSSVHGISQMKILESGSPFPPLGDLPEPGIKPASPALAGRFFTIEPWMKAFTFCVSIVSFWFVVTMRFFYGNLYV